MIEEDLKVTDYNLQNYQIVLCTDFITLSLQLFLKVSEQKKNIVIDLNNTSYLVRIYQDLSLFSIGMQHLLIFVKS